MEKPWTYESARDAALEARDGHIGYVLAPDTQRWHAFRRVICSIRSTGAAQVSVEIRVHPVVTDPRVAPATTWALDASWERVGEVVGFDAATALRAAVRAVPPLVADHLPEAIAIALTEPQQHELADAALTGVCDLRGVPHEHSRARTWARLCAIRFAEPIDDLIFRVTHEGVRWLQDHQRDSAIGNLPKP